MATLVRRRRLVNAGRRRRTHNARRRKNLSDKQIRFFGTKAQRAALKRRRHNARRRNAGPHSIRKAKKHIKRTMHPSHASRIAVSLYGREGYKKRKRTFRRKNVRHRRRTNVGSIITVYPMRTHNPRKRRRSNVARHKRRKSFVQHRQRRRRPNVVYRRRISRGVYRYTSNPRHRRRNRMYHRRHNAVRMGGMLGGTANKVLSIIGGATVTKLISDLLPMNFTSGVLGYLAIGLVAIGQGQIAGRMIFKSPTVGENMTAGGLVYLTIKILNDFVPSLGGALGLRGMGLIAPTQGFAVPLVNQMGSMGTFIRPGFVPAPYVPPAHAGLGSTQSIRRGGRIR